MGNKTMGLVPSRSQMVARAPGVPFEDVAAVREMLTKPGKHLVTVNAGHIVKIEPVGADIFTQIEDTDTPDEDTTDGVPLVRKTPRRAAKP